MTIRDAVIATWGTFWERSPLDPQTIMQDTHAGCDLRIVSLQTSPGVRVPGALMLPPADRGNGRGVLCIHQHAGQWELGKSEPIGKAGDPNMFYALELAQRGYVTFTIDLLAFEERRPQPKTSQVDGSGYERLVAMELLMQGHTLKGRYVWDLHRALDFLAAQPGVDHTRLGAIGHSLGGQSTLDIMLYDERIAAAVCSCGISTWASIFRDGVNHNMAAYAPGMLQVADTDAMVAALAPRAFFMSAGLDDGIFPVDGVEHIGTVAAEAYASVGVPDRFRLRTFPGGHGFPVQVRDEAYAWLDHWLHV